MIFYLLIVGVLSAVFAFLFNSYVPVADVINVLYRISGISATIFGVIGMWLTLSYRDDIITTMWTNTGSQKEDSARIVQLACQRCQFLFRGFKITACVFVVAVVVATALPWVNSWGRSIVCFHSGWVLFILRFLLVWILLMICFLQLYALLICISPMRHIVTELGKALQVAERILAVRSEQIDSDEGNDDADVVASNSGKAISHEEERQ